MLTRREVSSTALGWESVGGDAISTDFSRQQSVSNSSGGEFPAGSTSMSPQPASRGAPSHYQPHTHNSGYAQYLADTSHGGSSSIRFGYTSPGCGAYAESASTYDGHDQNLHHPSGNSDFLQHRNSYSSNSSSMGWPSNAGMTIGGSGSTLGSIPSCTSSFSGRQLPAPTAMRTSSVPLAANNSNLPVTTESYHGAPTWPLEQSAHTATNVHYLDCPIANQQFGSPSLNSPSRQTYPRQFDQDYPFGAISGPQNSLETSHDRWSMPAHSSTNVSHGVAYAPYHHPNTSYGQYHQSQSSTSNVGGHHTVLMSNTRSQQSPSLNRNKRSSHHSQANASSHGGPSTTQPPPPGYGER